MKFLLLLAIFVLPVIVLHFIDKRRAENFKRKSPEERLRQAQEEARRQSGAALPQRSGAPVAAAAPVPLLRTSPQPAPFAVPSQAEPRVLAEFPNAGNAESGSMSAGEHSAPSVSLGLARLEALEKAAAGMEAALETLRRELQLARLEEEVCSAARDIAARPKAEAAVSPPSLVPEARESSPLPAAFASSIPVISETIPIETEEEHSVPAAAFAEASASGVADALRTYTQATGGAEHASAPETEQPADLQNSSGNSAEPQRKIFAEAPFAAAREARKEKAPTEPSFLERAWEGLGDLGITKFISAGNLWVLGGIAVLLIGVVLLVRFAVEMGIFGPEARLAVAAFVGLALLATGWRHRTSRRELGLILQGGGVGAVYMTVVAAVQLYDLIPQPAAFALLVLITAFAAFLSVLQNAKIMAHITTVAGFAAPFLISRNSGNYIALFSYYILLNLAVVFISRFRSWRSLHLTAFLLTAGLGGLWGYMRYVPEMFWHIEAFLWAFMAIFTYLALAGGKAESFAELKKSEDLCIDLPLTLGTPLVFFLYQTIVAKGQDFATAFTCLILGAFYLLTAKRLWQTLRKGMEKFEEEAAARLLRGRRVQAELYLAFGIIFGNLALPFALTDLHLYDMATRMLCLTWALEGAALYWLGRRHQVLMFRVFGFVGFGLSLLHFMKYTAGGAPYYFTAEAPVSVEGVMDLAVSLMLHLLTASCLFTAAVAARSFPLPAEAAKNDKTLPQFLVIACAVFLYGSFYFETRYFEYRAEALLALFFGVSLLAARLAKKLEWKSLTLASFVCALPLAELVIPEAVRALRILASFGSNFLYGVSKEEFPRALAGLAVPAGFLLLEMFRLRTKTRRENAQWGEHRFTTCFGAMVLIAVPLVFTLVTPWHMPAQGFYRLLALLPAAAALAAILFSKQEVSAREFAGRSAVPVLMTFLWLTTDFFAYGDPAPLVFLPVLNPLEVGTAASLLLLFFTAKRLSAFFPNNPLLQQVVKPAIWVGLAFLAANVSIVRLCAFWTEMSYSFAGAARSGLCQSLMAVLWGAAGFAFMYGGHKHRRRALWITGALLVLADIAKLFLIDLTRLESIWRVGAFMAVGLLLILIGYLMPLPPARPEDAEGDTPGGPDPTAEEAPSSDEAGYSKHTSESDSTSKASASSESQAGPTSSELPENAGENDKNSPADSQGAASR